MNLRTFWRIIFDVIDVQLDDGSVEARPRLCVEMVLWDTASTTRLGRVMEEIPADVQPPGSVTFSNGVAVFDGGYIRGTLHRTALEDQLVTLLADNLESAEFGELSNPLGDLNVSIVALVRLLDDGAQEDRPLFYMNQPSSGGVLAKPGVRPSDAVRLSENIDAGGKRSVRWSISGDHHETSWLFQINDPPDDNPPRGWHRVRVTQDVGTKSAPFVYEILADAIPLDMPQPATPSSHYFYGDPVDFYIGGMPAPHIGIMGLHGEISYLEFDPNAPCSNCAG